jgi:hypothetical protein
LIITAVSGRKNRLNKRNYRRLMKNRIRNSGKVMKAARLIKEAKSEN